MKLFVIIFAALLFISCEEEPIDPIEKERKLCVYRVNTCTDANPLNCPPPLDFMKCINTWEASGYQDTRNYKLEDCERCNL